MENVLEILNKTELELFEGFMYVGGGELILEWFEKALREINTPDHDEASMRKNTALILSFIELFFKFSISWLDMSLSLEESMANFLEQTPQLVKEFLKKRLNLLHKTVENNTTEIQRVDQSEPVSPQRTPPQDDTCQQTVSANKKHPQDENIDIGGKTFVDKRNSNSSSLSVSREFDKRNSNHFHPEVSKTKRCCGPERLVLTSEDNHLPIKNSTTSIEKVIESTHGSDDDCILNPSHMEMNLGNVPTKIKAKPILSSGDVKNNSNPSNSEIEMPEIRQISGNEVALNIAYSNSRAGKNSASFHAPRSQSNCFQESSSTSSDNSNPKSLDNQKLFYQSMSSSNDVAPEDQSFLVSKIAYYCYRLGQLGKNG
ncbi:uncharacterized protein LOC141850714 isoform X2 [Brevipalpus obovatus]